MAEALPSPDLTFERLAWVDDWYIRDETYSKALAEIINFHTKIPFSAYWGDGKTSDWLLPYQKEQLRLPCSCVS